MAIGWNGATPSAVDDGPSTTYELGTEYTATGDVTLTKVRVWHGAVSGVVVGRTARVWTIAGALLGEVSIPDSLPSGWSSYALSTPIPRTAGQQFVVSYSTRQHYGAVGAPGFPVASADGLLSADDAAFSTTLQAFPTTDAASFLGVDVEYDAGLVGNTPPVASISVQLNGLQATATVGATDESPGTVSYRIEWGDGSSTVTAGPTAPHTYALPGIYAVMVLATDAMGAQDSASVPVVVRPPVVGAQTPYATFPDAEIALLDYLRSAIPGLACNVDIPEDYKASEGVYVRVRRVGGQPKFPASDYPMYDVEAYGPTRDAAATALGDVLGHLAVARYLPPVTGVFGQLTMITGPQYVPDPVTKEDRWQSLLTIPLRAKRA